MLTRTIKAFFSFSYWFVSSVRILLFKYKLKKQYVFSPFVVSIGNLSFGGAGKTPMVEYVSSFLSSIEVNHSIVSRGYKRAGKGKIVVSDKTAVLSSCSESGDEPFLLAHSLPGVPVVVGNKLKTIPLAAHQFASDLVIIDDGFQSLSVVRDLDIVLIDLSLKIKDYRLFPFGSLREPISAIRRAHVVVFTKKNFSVGDAQKIKSRILPFIDLRRSLVLDANYLLYLKKYIKKTSRFISFSQKISSSVVAFCGIANPKIFIESLSSFCAEAPVVKVFSDHHNYNKNDICLIKQLLLTNNSSTIITTKKDFFKIKNLFKGCSLFIIDVKHEIKESSSFHSYLQKKIISS